MSESEAAGATAQAFEILRIYLKDASFESPLSPAVFTEQREQWKPEYGVQLNAESHPQGDDIYEVVLSISVSAQIDEKTAWLVELKQAGLFKIAGFEAPQMGHMLGSFCPTQLFPYAREVISDLVGKGGFPQVFLQPINFDALLAQHEQQLQQAQGEGDSLVERH